MDVQSSVDSWLNKSYYTLARIAVPRERHGIQVLQTGQPPRSGPGGSRRYEPGQDSKGAKVNKELMLFSGRSHPDFANVVAKHLGVELGRVELEDFANENIKAKFKDNVRGRDIFVIQTSCTPVNKHLMELLVMIDALKYASAGRITAVLPYYPYVRSDKKDEPRISVTARLVADLLETAGAERILTMTLHAMQIMAFSRIPVDQLDGIPIICKHLAGRDLTNFVAVAPDIGRAKLTESYARWLELSMAVVDKRRDADTGEIEIRHVIGDVSGKNVIFLDDEILTGGSIVTAIERLRELGAKRFFAACVHGVLAEGAVRSMRGAGLEELVSTDPVPLRKRTDQITVCSVAELFAEAIEAIHTSTSVSRLFAK